MRLRASSKGLSSQLHSVSRNHTYKVQLRLRAFFCIHFSNKWLIGTYRGLFGSVKSTKCEVDQTQPFRHTEGFPNARDTVSVSLNLHIYNRCPHHIYQRHWSKSSIAHHAISRGHSDQKHNTCRP